MITNWQQALASYCYPVDLSTYAHKDEYPGCFSMKINGDRESTIAFEDRFRHLAQTELGAYVEVIYWKMYSQGGRANYRASVASDKIRSTGHSPAAIWQKIRRFVESPTRANLKKMRPAIGIASPVLPVALTFPAFADLERFPMLDTRVARWVNDNWQKANGLTQRKLTPFRLNSTSVRDNDFDNYLNWVFWCREMAKGLSESTGSHWRARDVEMAVFASTW